MNSMMTRNDLKPPVTRSEHHSIVKVITGLLLPILFLTLSLVHRVQAVPGDLDISFSGDGKVTTDFKSGSGDIARAVTIQNNAKIVVAGISDENGFFDFALARYNLSGSSDTIFSNNGIVTTNFGVNRDSFDDAFTVAIQNNGRIVAAGKSDAGGSFDFALARYEEDGDLDPTFGVGGKVITDFGTLVDNLDEAFALAIQSDGKILVTGRSKEQIQLGGDSSAVLARYETNGDLDPAFGINGRVRTNFGAFDRAKAIAIQPDAKIVVAGDSNDNANPEFVVERYNSDGSRDLRKL
ncbi:MAG: delta-60 repeat domain-containing protein [Chromatiales bacterium]